FTDEGWHGDVSVSDSEYLPEKYLKNLPEIRYDVSQAIWNEEDDVDVIANIENAEKATAKKAQAEAAAEKEREEQAIAAEKIKSAKTLSTAEVVQMLGKSRVITAEIFREYENLESIGIPLGVSEIKADAFANCKKLKEVYFSGTKKDWKAVSIDKNGNATLLKAKMIFKAIYSGAK
ncbi:MAG: leucine-rich repeat protein, partial [Spirochaetaceae bacterium]|nr:leucine-rich repeat protein [Spirochaetaceae bacterium]